MLSEIPDLVLLETERLQLRELSPRIYRHVFETYADIAIKRFFGCGTDEELNKERSRYEKGMETFNRSYFMFHMIEKESKRVIGSLGYHTWYILHDRAEIFYMIKDEQDRRKGYASEAIEPVIAYGFQSMNLHRIEAMLSSSNTASVKLVTKSGFEKEGVLKQHYLVDTVYEDSDVYGLLKHNHKPAQILTKS